MSVEEFGRDVMVVSAWMDITHDGRKKGLTFVVDEYRPCFQVRDKEGVLIGNATSIEELLVIVYDYKA